VVVVFRNQFIGHFNPDFVVYIKQVNVVHLVKTDVTVAHQTHLQRCREILWENNNHALLGVTLESDSLQTDDLLGIWIRNYDEPARFFLFGEVAEWNLLSSR
jgi:hypothetical protein